MSGSHNELLEQEDSGDIRCMIGGITVARKKIKKSVGYHIFGVANVLFFILVAVIMIVPFLNVICLSLEPEHIALDPSNLHLIPQQPTFEAYIAVFKNQTIIRSFFNSVYITVISSSIAVFISAMFGYALTYRNIVGYRFFSFLLLFSMMFSGGIIPSYMLMKDLHLIDSLWSLILSGLLSAYNVILMKTYFLSIPVSLSESAMLDGASEMQVFFKIILPLSTPIIATVTLFYAVGTWNEFFNGIMYINSAEKKPLQVILREILLLATADSTATNSETSLQLGTNVQMAVAIISMLPIMCVYPFLQKHFTKGIMLGAVKG